MYIWIQLAAIVNNIFVLKNHQHLSISGTTYKIVFDTLKKGIDDAKAKLQLNENDTIEKTMMSELYSIIKKANTTEREQNILDEIYNNADGNKDGQTKLKELLHFLLKENGRPSESKEG